jgi:hypothetical protein
MEEKSFLPDNRPVEAHILAQLSLPRETIELIAKGANPADQRVYGNPAPVWGLLYICATGLGFFVHPANNFGAFGFRTSTDSEQNEPIDLFIPFGQIAHKELIHPRKPKTWLGKALSRIILMSEHAFVISWKHYESTHTLRFSIANDTTAFETALNEH